MRFDGLLMRAGLIGNVCVRALPVVILLAGCSTGPLVPEGTDYVRISSVDPSLGRSSDTIFANDRLKRETPNPGTTDVRVSWAVLPDGTYAQARAIVERDMPRVTARDFDLCPTDASIQSISVNPPVAGIDTVSKGCAPNGFDRLLRELMTLMPPWRQGDA